jgi:hypothetical protein
LRNSLLKEGYDLGDQTNPLASIHSILKRLNESGEAEQTEVDGKAFYRWKGAVPTNDPVKFPRRESDSEPPRLNRPTRRQVRQADEAERAERSEQKRAEARAAMEKAKKSKSAIKPIDMADEKGNLKKVIR